MTKKKAMRKSASPTAAAATKALDRLISDKQQTVGDGSLQIILAIASVTALVTVDATTTPPTVKPPNLGQLKFNDPAVGISNSQMAIFKGNLAILLPQIAADVANIPENAALKIADVAKFVSLALLSASGA